MLDATLKADARRIAGHSAAYTAGALRRAADVSAWAASSLADSLDGLAGTLAPKKSRNVEKWIGGAIAALVIAGVLALIVRRRRAKQETPETSAADLEVVRDQRSAS
ncbi:MAG: hypothetical protein QNJ88_17305 [Acidimicrobiia bacterium]|nr:hypothetical protein [Acidimicrobiia bacterium]